MNIDLLTSDIMNAIRPFIPVEHWEDVAGLIKDQCEKAWNEVCMENELDRQLAAEYWY
jgi:hypothetical protein